VSYDRQGGLVSLAWSGYVAFCLVASLFLQRFGVKRSVLAGYFLVCAGAVVTMAAPSLLAASLALLVVNAGFGFFEVGTNALGTVAFTRKPALLMGLLHFFYGFGAIAGPKAAGFLTTVLDFSWRQVYIATIAPTALLALFVLSVRFDHVGSTGRAGAEDSSRAEAQGLRQASAEGHLQAGAGGMGLTFFDALRSPLVWVFAVTLGFMEVVEFGAANWGALHLQDVYQLDPRTAGASLVSAFYILFTLSRLLSGLAIEKIGYIRSLCLAAICTIAVFLAGFGLARSGIWILPLTGLFIGIMWPTMMAVAMGAFGADAPIVTSAIIVVSGAINGVMQLVIGFTNEIVGEAWGYRSCLLYAVVVLLCLGQLSRRLSQRDSTPSGWRQAAGRSLQG
jgi:fucose permease